MGTTSIRRARASLAAAVLRLLTVILVLCAPSWARAFSPPPVDGHVTDPAGQLSPDVEEALESKLAAFRVETTDEIAVFVAPSLQGETIEDVAYATFNAWGIGDAAKDNGVLFVWAPAERKIRIETGKGLGDRLTDARASRIIRDVVTPHFKASRFPRGVDAGVDAIIGALRGEPFRVPESADATSGGTGQRPVARGSGLMWWLQTGLFCVIAFVAIRMARRGGGGGGGWTATSSGWSSSSGSSSSSSSYSGGGGSSGGGGASGSY